ncbi:phosphoribosylglycinamide formyltransferase [Candidatus Providencia siddallii]|uniref:Phosphoribosylglycinamide formyltransferase n=1 Tax=Candidatus Providencia siddallii TaxID=1715285 RepID=A0ABM9NNU8_9GAMM
MKKIIVFISGNGEILQSLINNCKNGLIKANIIAVISNKKYAYGLFRAKKAKIPTFYIDKKNFINRNSYDKKLLKITKYLNPELIVLAGFMHILSLDFINFFKGKILNIHPSLLPKYPGLNTHNKVINNNEKEHGTTVHFVTEILDNGPIILQSKITISKKDTKDTLIKRIKIQEKNIYPLVVKWFISGRLIMKNNKAILDGHVLSIKGLK